MPTVSNSLSRRVEAGVLLARQDAVAVGVGLAEEARHVLLPLLAGDVAVLVEVPGDGGECELALDGWRRGEQGRRARAAAAGRGNGGEAGDDRQHRSDPVARLRPARHAWLPPALLATDIVASVVCRPAPRRFPPPASTSWHACCNQLGEISRLDRLWDSPPTTSQDDRQASDNAHSLPWGKKRGNWPWLVSSQGLFVGCLRNNRARRDH